MLARVKWNGERRVDGTWLVEHGTLLGFVYTATGAMCMIAQDGNDQYNRGSIITKEYHRVTVTTWFKWSSPPTHITGPSTEVMTNGRG